MPQDGFHLLTSYAWKPFEEVIHARAVFQILEQRLGWHTRPFEQPSAADFSRHPLNRGTLAPIKHAARLAHAAARCKGLHYNEVQKVNGKEFPEALNARE